MPAQTSEPRRLWVDLRELLPVAGQYEVLANYQDHGIGLLRTILTQAGIQTDLISTGNSHLWFDVLQKLAGYDMLLMNIRSYNWAIGYRVARMFKELNPKSKVIVGGMHATVSPQEMIAIPEIDHICQGPGERIIVDLVRNPDAFPRVIKAEGSPSMADWPMIDRTLWPKPPAHLPHLNRFWPLEPGVFGPSPVVTLLTSRVCPWQCSFCNEHSYISNMGRRPVEMVIDELNFLDKKYGPLGSLVIHDSMFFQNPTWLQEWLEKYPRKARKPWPYWAAGRADTVRKWPELFEALVRQTNWNAISIGFESGSTKTLRTLNKQCTEEDNYFAIDLLNKIGDDMERSGKNPPYFFTNIMYGIPGETREDAFKTARMIKAIKRKLVSHAFYAPYRGSILGYQLIAEGKSLMTREEHDRFPNKKRVNGVDYQFYNDLMSGKYDREVEMLPRPPSEFPDASAVPNAAATRTDQRYKFSPPHFIYFFTLKNGKKRSAWGTSAEDALEVLSFRLTPEELAEIDPTSYVQVTQTQMQEYLPQLG